MRKKSLLDVANKKKDQREKSLSPKSSKNAK